MLTGVKTQNVGGAVADDLQGVEQSEDAFVGHNRDAAATAYFGHRDMVMAAGGLLEESNMELLKAGGGPDCVLNGVAAVGIHGEPDVRTDGLTDGSQPLGVDAWMLVASYFHFDRFPAALHHARGSL